MMPTGMPALDVVGRRVERQDLGIDGQLAQAPRDQLGELRPEIEDDDGLMIHWACRGTIGARRPHSRSIEHARRMMKRR